ncbi:MAG: FAD-dependent oxidoreductase, partial [Rhodospirillaceae bacterium]|nr:FAD-dependent oxidoreductase [Rhodospirillaceae bacterium]
PAAELAAWAASPMVVEFRGDYAFYLVPPRAGTGFKIGDHRFTLAGDPDRDRVAAAGEADPMLEAAKVRLRNGADYRLIEAKTCFYDVEPEERFILEPLGAAGYAMSGFSGHGFKFGALMGELAAAAVLGEKDADKVRRFAAGEDMPLP